MSKTHNKDLIDFIAEFNNWIYDINLEGFAVAMGKNPEHAPRDGWIVEKFEKLKKTPLELFDTFDRGHQALLLRAIDGCTKNDYDSKYGDYDYHVGDLGVYVSVHYTIEHESDYGADADGNRGVPMTTVLIESPMIHCNGIDVSAYFDACEIDPDSDDSLQEKILEFDRERREDL